MTWQRIFWHPCREELTALAYISCKKIVEFYRKQSQLKRMRLLSVLGRVDTKPNNASFRQNFTHPALKSLDRRQPACDFLPCLRKIYARKSAYYLSVNTP